MNKVPSYTTHTGKLRNRDCIDIIHVPCGQIAFKVLREHWRAFVLHGGTLDSSKAEYPDGTKIEHLERMRCGSCQKLISHPLEITWKWTK